MPTILVIDDASTTRELMSALLESEGYETVCAANGKEGWATLYSVTPDLIMLDLMMPQMDGVTFLHLLRNSERWGGLPVIVLTGVDDDAEPVKRARKLVVNDLIRKGFVPAEEVLDRVKKHLPRKTVT